MNTFVVYKLTSPSGKTYIGKAKNFNRRMNAHRSTAARATDNFSVIHRAIRKHGWENFAKEILAFGLTEEVALAEERRFIALFDSFGPNGYNVTAGGEGQIGTKRSEEHKRRISESAKANWRDPVLRAQMSENISKAKKGHKAHPSTKAKLLATNLGKHHSAERKAKISASGKGAWAAPGHRAKRSSAMAHVYADPAYKAKQRENMRRVWAERKEAKLALSVSDVSSC